MVEEVIIFFIMELEECDYWMVIGFVVFGILILIDIIYYDEWYEFFNVQKNWLLDDKEVWKKYDDKIKMFFDFLMVFILFSDVFWFCDGDVQDMVVVMFVGEEILGFKISVLNKLLFFGIQIIFFYGFLRIYVKKIKSE